jgi:hypothetical protein
MIFTAIGIAAFLAVTVRFVFKQSHALNASMQQHKS